MGMLDNLLGSMGGGRPQQRPGLGSTVAAGAVLALLVSAVRKHQASHPAGAPGENRSFQPDQAPGTAPAQQAGMPGGLGGILSGLTGGQAGGLGGVLGGLGGAGALAALVNQFQQNGYGQQVASWISQGANHQIAPNQVAQALGEDNIQELQQSTGLSRENILSELSEHLPQAVDAISPQGRLPGSDSELTQVAGQPAPHA